MTVTQIADLSNPLETKVFDAESFSLTFIDDSDCEFVGGGTAVNGL